MNSRRESDQLETKNIEIKNFTFCLSGQFLCQLTFSLIHYVYQILAKIGQIQVQIQEEVLGARPPADSRF